MPELRPLFDSLPASTRRLWRKRIRRQEHERNLAEIKTKKTSHKSNQTWYIAADGYKVYHAKTKKQKQPKTKPSPAKPHSHKPVLNYTDRNNILIEQFNGMRYAEYLKTPLWLAIRNLALTRNKNCKRCGKPATEVHHSSYAEDVLKGASLEPLWSVCHRCHELAEFNPHGSKRLNIQDVNAILATKT